MVFHRFRSIILIAVFFLMESLAFAGVFPLQQDSAYVSPFAQDNERCFQCHGQEKYTYRNETLSKDVSDLMCPNRIVRRDEFYRSNHKSFSCTDCHSADYVNFPHSGQLRMEEKFNCIDCHGGDEKYASYHFEEIEAEYQQSVHYARLQNEGFTCWKCHNPHTYKISVRNDGNLKSAIAYDNAICLSCHSNFNRFQLLTERSEINIIEKHDWLPNQTAHFSSVRCIECHTKLNDSIPVAHLIRPKEEAVKRCNECHSQNSLLMASLYKFESKERRHDGFLNGIILNESYVIGANRNEYLNILSLVILVGVIGVILIHIIFRIRKSNKNSKY